MFIHLQPVVAHGEIIVILRLREQDKKFTTDHNQCQSKSQDRKSDFLQ